MAPEPQQGTAGTAQRVFEQPPDAMICYADFAQIIGTGNEVIFQFYESVPGPPTGPGGQVQAIRTRLRATVTVSPTHAVNLLNALSEQLRKKDVPRP